jgi:hypothetical protein
MLIFTKITVAENGGCCIAVCAYFFKNRGGKMPRVSARKDENIA